MIDLTVPEHGQQPRDLVLAAVADVFDGAMDLTTPGAEPPQLGPTVQLAQAASARDDEPELDRLLLLVAVAAIATLVRIRCAPDTPPTS